jgi:hypothetical protein
MVLLYGGGAMIELRNRNSCERWSSVLMIAVCYRAVLSYFGQMPRVAGRFQAWFDDSECVYSLYGLIAKMLD